MKLKPRNNPKRSRAIVNCTHLTMERVFVGFDDLCSLCGKVPTLGFLYECRQDCDFGSPYLGMVLDGPPGDACSKSQLRQELEQIGLSESVITTAEKGDYTRAQLDRLKHLKLKLNEEVTAIAQACKTTYAVNKMGDTDGAAVSTFTQESFQCQLRACHTCRPYFNMRTYTSFDAVFADELKPITVRETATLPTKSAKTIRGINVDSAPPPPPPPKDYPPSFPPTFTRGSFPSPRAPSECSSVLTFKTTQSDIDNINSTRYFRRRFYSLGHNSSIEIARDIFSPSLFSRQGLKAVFQSIFRSSRDSSSSGSNITLPMPRTGTARQLEEENPVGEFDIGALRRVRRQKERSELRYARYLAASNQQAMGISLGLQQHSASHEDDEQYDESSSDSDFTVYSCISEGSEVEVDGGVALTEEAVSTLTPDILTAPLPSSSAPPSFKDQPVGLEKDEMSLGALMTQV
ncbi:hypothetical protein DM02DRAFT_250166 [Periconia macrospinosa]|uniref:Uncharacterized protein n=1 Tax=Periconia macrospinosa TaxID=97972 RepID=A0A2V1D511_9PLEO|nr:hypothetical protein DM02DRAFT_250166 [Periconia macrospinosa]